MHAVLARLEFETQYWLDHLN